MREVCCDGEAPEKARSRARLRGMPSAPTERCEAVGNGGDFEISRRELRDETVRFVAVTPVVRGSRARVRPAQRVGFTRDISHSGMCLGLDEFASVGSLLHVTLQDSRGRPLHRAVGRVVWSRHDTDCRFWHGLELVGNGPGPLVGLARFESGSPSKG